ncbi:MAG: NTP transferase domain-containing protein, partial [Kiritimatiellae bacterium]|nr:NTP transferase domain-containing protein [Kiritimatiellia bacterium]
MSFKAVILAGGSGERFWPLSTPERPKQFLRVFGGESLIRQALARLDGLVAPEDAFVVTTKSLVAATRKELPEVPKGNIIGEPMRRDTGAAVALGVGLAAQRGRKPRLQAEGEDDPVIGFFSSDQMVANPKAFRKVVSKAVAIARRKQVIVTLGIKPTYPATCFGYISPKTRTFVEKPDAKTAKKYVKAGYLWNAGMFIGLAETFKGAFAAYAPELATLAAAKPPFSQ